MAGFLILMVDKLEELWNHGRYENKKALLEQDFLIFY
jgi:hypothetical protein